MTRIPLPLRSWLSAYIPTLCLTVLAVWLGWWGLTTKDHDSAAGAGIALAGVGTARLLDVAATRARQRRKDLDETRRLLYMVLHMNDGTSHAELVATVVNALAHHELAIPADEAHRRVVAALQSSIPKDPKDLEWIEDQIAVINARLG